MDRLLIIMGNHSPNPSSVSNCFEPLLNKLISKGFKIDLVTNRKNLETLQFDKINNVNVYRVDDNYIISNHILNELQKIELPKILKIITKLLTLILKGFIRLRYYTFAKEKQTAGWTEKRVLEKCLELSEVKNYKAVISVSHPFKSHYVARTFKKRVNKPLKWFMFEFDPYYYNETTNKVKSVNKRKKLFNDEYNMFQECDKVFLTPELYKFYKKTSFNFFSNKFIPVPFANMQQIEYKKNIKQLNFDSQKINCIFTGRFYNDIRNPNYALKIFMQLNDQIHLTLLTNYDHKAIEKNLGSVDDKFTVYPLQPHDIALNALDQSNILVNIGNTVEFQIPGKIFEYMSTGKPIVHFSKTPNDSAITYLEKYPIVLIIKEWEGDVKRQAEELEEFCFNNKDKKISYKDVCVALDGLDGDSVSNKFVDTVKSLLEDS